jgi:hypothetical protein
LLKHIVMFKLKEAALGADKAENLQRVRWQLVALKDKLAEIKSFEVGVNVTNSGAAYDLALLSEFDSQTALLSYQSHPEHLKVAEFVQEVCASRIVVDYFS